MASATSPGFVRTRFWVVSSLFALRFAVVLCAVAALIRFVLVHRAQRFADSLRLGSVVALRTPADWHCRLNELPRLRF